MVTELLAALDEIERSTAQVAILTGAGKAFCSGMDLEGLRDLAAQAGKAAQRSEAETHEPDGAGVMDVAVRVLKGQADEPAPSSPISEPTELAFESSRALARMFRRIYDFPKPLIAAVNGAAIAGGCGIATLCDFTLAVPEAKFGYTEVRIGFVPAIVSVFLIRQIGEKRARDLLLTGRIIDAEEGYRLGLVSEIVPPQKLMDRARELAGQLLENSPTSLSYTKHLLTNPSQQDIDRGLELAIEAHARIRSTPDFEEGLSAFLEKRKPVWRSR
jgi:methylglutaconyl-CoA hydratase